MTDRELMQMVLDTLESFESGTNGIYTGEFAEERKALRDRLAQPDTTQVAPPKREWVGLTDEEVGGLTVFDGLTNIEVPILADFVRATEAKLKEKNT
jgi:hypothetical protein